ncbi:hypothetical protein [Alicyclobacillus fastidiosus]|uniref:Uncharacterized protein n=1 Tax=Alicyclobacillus fastidiosus TaxID=392011 RepID=A0ABV5AHB2_9BACL|nr:hypothetical protein [Alicyclobacillus fastidiosus]WEH08165.1 hypothetical protein PYS47_15780 [Alicyclobacillus fastidiosus]
MYDFAEFKEVRRASDVDELLKQGWVVVSVNKTVDVDRSEYSEFIMGLPSSIRIEQLLSIIKDYEEAGCKEELFRHKASKLDPDYTYEQYLNSEKERMFGVGKNRPLAKYISNYRSIVSI